jgi:membrane-associated phospholipid phosphatase
MYNYTSKIGYLVLKQGLRQIVLRIALILLGIGLFGAIAEDVILNGPLTRVDLSVNQFLKVHVKPSFGDLMQVISRTGSELIFVVSPPLALYLILRQRWRECNMLLLGVGGGETVNLLLKMLFARQKRPSAVSLTTLDDYMFPSGHAMVSFIFYGLVAYLVVRSVQSRRWRALISIALAVVVLLVGFSQLIVGGHYLSDVLGGYALGLVWLVLTISSVESLRRRQLDT